MANIIHGYYDGTAFQAIAKTTLKKNQRVIITILDDFEKMPPNEDEERIKKIEKMSGILSEYANSELRKQEGEAWKRAVVENKRRHR